MTKPIDKNKKIRARRENKTPMVRRKIVANTKRVTKKRKNQKKNKNFLKRFLSNIMRWFLWFLWFFFSRFTILVSIVLIGFVIFE